MSNVCDNRIKCTASEAKTIRTVFDKRFKKTAFAILLAVSISISWSGTASAGTTSSAQTFSSSCLHEHELIAGIPFIKSKSKDGDAKAKEDEKAGDDKKAEKEQQKSDAKAEATKKSAEKAAEKAAKKLGKQKDKSESKTQSAPEVKAESKASSASEEKSGSKTQSVPGEKSKAKAAKKGAKGKLPTLVNEQSDTSINKAAIEKVPSEKASAEKATLEKSSAINGTHDSNSHRSQVDRYQADGALISLLNDLARALKDPAEQAQLNDADQKFVLSVAAEVLAKAVESRSDGNRIIDKQSMNGGPMSVEAWSSGDVKVSDDCRGSIAAVWAKKENGLLDVTIAGACHNRTAPSGKKVGEYIVVLSANSSVQKGFDVQSQSDVQFWLAKLNSIRIEAECCSNESNSADKTSANAESETKELRLNSTVVLQSVVTEREHEFSKSDLISVSPDTSKSDRTSAAPDNSKSNQSTSDRLESKVTEMATKTKPSNETEKARAEVNQKNADKKHELKTQEKRRAKEEKLAEAENKRKAADQERQAKIAEKEKEKQDELRADAEAEKQHQQEELAAQAEKERDAQEKERDAQEKQRLVEAKKQEKYQAKQAELDRKRIIAESKTNNSERDMTKSLQDDGAARVAQNANKNSKMSREDMILAEATRQAEIEAQGGIVPPDSYNSESSSRADMVLAEAMRQAEQERREAADMRVPYNAQTNPPVVDIDDQLTALRPTPTAAEQTSNQSPSGSQSVPPAESSNNVTSTESTKSDPAIIAEIRPLSSISTHEESADPRSAITTAPSKNTPSLMGTRMVLPERSIAGQYITAAVIDQKNNGASGVELRFNGLSLLTDDRGEVAYKVPDDTTPGESLNVAMPGNPRIRAFPIEVLQPLSTSAEQGAPTVERASKMVASNGTIVIGGHNFDGMAAHNLITIDNSRECKVLAASPVELVVAVPNTIAPGSHHATVSLGPLKSNGFDFEVVVPQVVSAPNSPRLAQLNRIFVKVLGTTNKVQVHLTNQTPDVIKISQGNDVHLTSSGGKDNSASVTFQRLRKGSYRVGAVID